MSKKGSGPAPAPNQPPPVCLLHLNFEPCPFCVTAELEHQLDEIAGEIEAAVIDTTPRRRRVSGIRRARRP